MKQCLVDVNVWLAVVVVQHVHHGLAMRWFESLEAGEAGMCRIVQLGLVRLLANPSAIGNDAVSVSAAWRIAEKLLGDARVEFVSEPTDIDATMPELLKYKEPTGKLVTDA